MTLIPATQEVEIGRIEVQSQPQQSVSQTPISTKKLSMVLNTCHPTYIGSISRKSTIQDSPGKNVRLYLKNNRIKKGWGYS
jgi:hypothetical protein